MRGQPPAASSAPAPRPVLCPQHNRATGPRPGIGRRPDPSRHTATRSAANPGRNGSVTAACQRRRNADHGPGDADVDPVATGLDVVAGLVDACAVRTPVRTVAVVGNAPVTPEPARSAAIDGAELVIRVDGFALDGPRGPPGSRDARRRGRRPVAAAGQPVGVRRLPLAAVPLQGAGRHVHRRRAAPPVVAGTSGWWRGPTGRSPGRCPRPSASRSSSRERPGAPACLVVRLSPVRVRVQRKIDAVVAVRTDPALQEVRDRAQRRRRRRTAGGAAGRARRAAPLPRGAVRRPLRRAAPGRRGGPRARGRPPRPARPVRRGGLRPRPPGPEAARLAAAPWPGTADGPDRL